MLVVGEVMTSLSPAFAAASPDLATLLRTTRLALSNLQVSLSVQCSDCRPPFKPRNSLYHRHYNVFHKSIETPRDISPNGVKYLENMRGDLHVCGAYYFVCRCAEMWTEVLCVVPNMGICFRNMVHVHSANGTCFRNNICVHGANGHLFQEVNLTLLLEHSAVAKVPASQTSSNTQCGRKFPPQWHPHSWYCSW